MAATKVRRFVPNRDYTHDLMIKLHHSSMLPQLETSFKRFRKDGIAAGIHQRAFLPPGIGGLYLGKISLQTPQRREDFSRFLHSIDYRKLLGPAPGSAQISSAATEQLDMARSRFHGATLRINFTGLTIPQATDPSNVRALSLLATDPTGRVQPFWSSLIDFFTVAGFPILKPRAAPRWEFVSSFIVDRVKSKAFIDRPDKQRHIKRRPVPTFDARELIKKYDNTTWAKDVPLERLSLLGLGASETDPDGEIVMKQQPEIDSVALHDGGDVGKLSAR